MENGKDMRRFAVISLLLVAYALCEAFSGLDITGAFIAGPVIARHHPGYLCSIRFEKLVLLFLSPVFFASIGLSDVVSKLPVNNYSIFILLVLVSVATKLSVRFWGAKVCHYSNKESDRIGNRMFPR
jgi:Kef-type K+ transport system membrane component KefB